MKLETWLATVLGAAAVGLVATAAQAAPVTGVNGTRGFRFYYAPRYHRRHWHYRRW